jgi:hypothetical protein
MYIEGSAIKVSGDSSPEEETIVERQLMLVCRNPQCSHTGNREEMRVRLN